MVFSSGHVVIVGLGNPGRQYEETRHNIGFAALRKLAGDWKIDWNETSRFEGWIAKGKVVGKEGPLTVHLLMPTTYMNRSGRSIRKLLEYYKLGPQDVIIVTDDKDLPLGGIRLKTQGSSGGHRGLQNIEEELKTRQFIRLRMGVGVPIEHRKEKDTADFVLAKFSEEENEQVIRLVDQAVSALKHLIADDVNQVMNRVNAKKKTSKSPEGEEKENERRNEKPL